MNLRESLQKYSEYKKSMTGSTKLNEQEIKAVRKAWREGKFNEVKKENLPTFREMVEAYKKFKFQESGTNTITVKEYKSLKAKFEEQNKSNSNSTSKNDTITLKEMIKKYQDFKLQETGSNKINAKEYKALKEAYKKGEFQKLNEDQPINPVTGKINENKDIATTVMKHVREARLASYKAKMALKEGDMAMAQDSATQAVDSTNEAMDVMADATQGQVPQNVVDSVSSVKAAVDDLATQCGIEPTTDPNADPNANIPAVNDPNAADPNATAEPMLENNKVDTKAIRERLAAREKALKSIKEGKGGVDPTIANPLANIGGKLPDASPRFVDKKDSESQLPTPTLASLQNGTEKGATRWPTQKLNLKENESLAEQVVSKHLKESSENMDFADILMSGVLG